MTDEQKETIEHAESILSCICNELGLAESASDPYPLEDDYIDWMLSATQGLVYHNDEEWVYRMPSLAQAKEIILSHDEELDYE